MKCYTKRYKGKKWITCNNNKSKKTKTILQKKKQSIIRTNKIKNQKTADKKSQLLKANATRNKKIVENTYTVSHTIYFDNKYQGVDTIYFENYEML